jgi:hypothetical protein
MEACRLKNPTSSQAVPLRQGSPPEGVSSFNSGWLTRRATSSHTAAARTAGTDQLASEACHDPNIRSNGTANAAAAVPPSIMATE